MDAFSKLISGLFGDKWNLVENRRFSEVHHTLAPASLQKELSETCKVVRIERVGLFSARHVATCRQLWDTDVAYCRMGSDAGQHSDDNSFIRRRTLCLKR